MTTSERGAILRDLARSVQDHTELAIGNSPYPTAITEISLLRAKHAGSAAQCLIKPALYMTLQGTKWATFDEKRYTYEAGKALVVSVDVPSYGTVSVASPREPYLGLVMDLDFAMMQSVAEEIRSPRAAASTRRARGAFILELDGRILRCAQRAVDLLDTPEAASILYPGISREVCYWLLTGPEGARISDLLMIANGQDEQVVQAVYALRDELDTPIVVKDLALIANMSPATFHRHFKAITGMAPLQYQKQLRLHEARRLLIFSNATLETAARKVGYVSVSQFSREFSRLFGNSPRREVSTWRRSQSTQ